MSPIKTAWLLLLDTIPFLLKSGKKSTMEGFFVLYRFSWLFNLKWKNNDTMISVLWIGEAGAQCPGPARVHSSLRTAGLVARQPGCRGLTGSGLASQRAQSSGCFQNRNTLLSHHQDLGVLFLLWVCKQLNEKQIHLFFVASREWPTVWDVCVVFWRMKKQDVVLLQVTC